MQIYIWGGSCWKCLLLNAKPKVIPERYFQLKVKVTSSLHRHLWDWKGDCSEMKRDEAIKVERGRRKSPWWVLHRTLLDMLRATGCAVPEHTFISTGKRKVMILQPWTWQLEYVCICRLIIKAKRNICNSHLPAKGRKERLFLYLKSGPELVSWRPHLFLFKLFQCFPLGISHEGFVLAPDCHFSLSPPSSDLDADFCAVRKENWGLLMTWEACLPCLAVLKAPI